ncbi:hypothetical protein D3C74_290720 [compost metagenome]
MPVFGVHHFTLIHLFALEFQMQLFFHGMERMSVDAVYCVCSVVQSKSRFFISEGPSAELRAPFKHCSGRVTVRQVCSSRKPGQTAANNRDSHEVTS